MSTQNFITLLQRFDPNDRVFFKQIQHLETHFTKQTAVQEHIL